MSKCMMVESHAQADAMAFGMTPYCINGTSDARTRTPHFMESPLVGHATSSAVGPAMAA